MNQLNQFIIRLLHSQPIEEPAVHSFLQARHSELMDDLMEPNGSYERHYRITSPEPKAEIRDLLKPLLNRKTTLFMAEISPEDCGMTRARYAKWRERNHCIRQ